MTIQQIKQRRRLMRLMGGNRILPEGLQIRPEDVQLAVAPKPKPKRIPSAEEIAFGEAMDRAAETDWEGK